MNLTGPFEQGMHEKGIKHASMYLNGLKDYMCILLNVGICQESSHAFVHMDKCLNVNVYQCQIDLTVSVPLCHCFVLIMSLYPYVK